MHAADRHHMENAGRDINFDDAFHVEPHDEQILAYWDEDEVPPP